MVLTLGNFVGFESGGTEEASATTGSPSVQSTTKRSGTYALQMPLSTAEYDINPFQANADAGDDQIVGFAIRFTNLPSTIAACFDLLESGTPAIVVQVSVVDVSGTKRWRLSGVGFTALTGTTISIVTGQWYYVELRWQHSDSGAIDLYVDGVSEISGSAKDMSAAGTFDLYRFRSDTSIAYYVDDFYCYSGAAGVSDFLGTGAEVLGAYADTAGAATEQGSALDAGTWANLSEVPVSATNTASYTGTPRAGHMRTDEGTKSGPAAAITGTAKAGKWFWRLERGGGGGTTHTLRFGTYDGASDTTSTSTQVLTTSAANYFRFSTSNFPDSSGDYFLTGFEVSGNQDLVATEALCFLLHVATTSVTINAALGVLTLTGLTADAVPGAVTVQSTVGVLTLTGLAATVANVVVIQTTIGVLTLTGQAASIVPGAVTVQSTIGVLTLTGLTASIQAGPVTVQTVIGVLTLTGQSASIVPVTTIQAALGVLTLTGQAASIVPGAVTVSAALGILTLTGIAAAVQPGAVTVQTSIGVLTLTGLAASVTVTGGGGLTINAALGVLTLTGQTATVTPGAVSVSAALGILTLTGETASIQPGGVSINAALGVLTLTGQSASISGVVTLSAALGTLTLTGLSSTVIPGAVTISAALGTLVLSGLSVTVNTPGLFLPFIRVTIPPYITHDSMPPFVTDAPVDPADSGGDVVEYISHDTLVGYRTDRTVP